MRNAVDEEIQRGKAKQMILDYPFGCRHPRFADIIDLDVFIDTPLDVAMARRILRDYSDEKSSEEALEHLRGELTHLSGEGSTPIFGYLQRQGSE